MIERKKLILQNNLQNIVMNNNMYSTGGFRPFNSKQMPNMDRQYYNKFYQFKDSNAKLLKISK